MNAADQRRLSPWLAGLCVLLVVSWAVLLFGVGRGIHWGAPAAVRPLPSATDTGTTDEAPALKRYAEVWQRPLFTTDRRPVPVNAASGGEDASLDDLQLTGVILAPGMHMALLSDPESGRTMRVAEGAQMSDSAWVLKTLKPRSAMFAGHGQVVHLELKVASGDGAAPATSSTAREPRKDPPPEAPAKRPKRTGEAEKAHVKSLRDRIKQRRRDHAAPAGER